MALKRKRSTPTFTSSSPFSSSSTADSSSSIPYFYAQSKPTEPLLPHTKPSWSFPTYDSSPESQHSAVSSHLNSRTRKRHRDSRPSEQSIYGVSNRCLSTAFYMTTLADVCRVAASTISRLYEAQRQNPRAEPILSAPSQPISAMPMAGVAAPSQRSTLHSFWKIGSQPVPNSSVDMVMDSGIDSGTTSMESLVTCEDCDGALRVDGDAMDLDDGMMELETACSSCRRHICDRCAVLGNERVCLGCANR